jgi:hypothetical protein
MGSVAHKIGRIDLIKGLSASNRGTLNQYDAGNMSISTSFQNLTWTTNQLQRSERTITQHYIRKNGIKCMSDKTNESVMTIAV